MQPVPSPAAPPSGHRRPCQPIILLPLVAGGLQPIIFPSTTTPPSRPAPLPPASSWSRASPAHNTPQSPKAAPAHNTLPSPKASPSHNTARRLTCGPNPSPLHTSRLCQRRQPRSRPSLPPPSRALSLPPGLPPALLPWAPLRAHPAPACALTSPPASPFLLRLVLVPGPFLPPQVLPPAPGCGC